MIGISHRYLTQELPGIGGRIRAQLDDFVVEEQPLYSPCGSGEHVYFCVEKRDLSTLEALEWLAARPERPVRDFGYAGLKDRKGVTRQTISLRGGDLDEIESLEVSKLKVLWADRHQNKLRVGHLRGNRFSIRVRGACEGAGELIDPIVERVRACGLPNYFGPQRFGNRGDAQWVGLSMLRLDARGAVRRILGSPSETENNPNVVAARYLFLQYRWREAFDRFPPSYREERRLLEYLLRAGERYSRAIKSLRREIQRLYFSAFQSYLFNQVLERRLEASEGLLGTMWEGDVAFLHRNGAVFTVENPDAEQPRADEFEISPSGPIFGKKTVHPTGGHAEIEQGVLADFGCRAADFHQLQQRCQLDGGRRPLRVRVDDLSWREDEDGLVFDFFLPKGSYATTFLREIMKNEEIAPGYGEMPEIPSGV